MAIEIRGSTDETLDAIASAFEAYSADRPGVEVAMYRQSPYSIRVRVLDPAFETMSRGERSRLVWSYLAKLTEDQQADINMLLLRTPEEIRDSFANMEFEDPLPPILLNGAKVE
ncbi:MAG: hypothetical protein BGO49_18060 [Planctomycetales bacterium 71-10]|nr:MAG: hypothetical protein BGO49_18060 [Planctomycetales bacterium 71-10]